MEDELIRRAAAGEEAAFRQLVQRYGVAAGRTARVLLADAGAAEDAVQEAWVDVWRHLPRFTLGRPFRPWLLTLVANRCRMAARRPVPPTVALEAADAATLADPADVAGTVISAAADAELAAALEALPREQQRVVALRYFADLDLAEIGAVTGVPVGTVKSRLHRARATLHDLFASRPAAGPDRPGGPRSGPPQPVRPLARPLEEPA